MTDFQESYIGQIRSLIGARLLRVPGTRIVIVNDSGEVLLQKRSDFALWGLPGGSGEIGESVEDTIIREVKEETGLIVHALTPFGYASSPEHEVITFPNGHVCHFHSLIFTTNSFSGVLSSKDQETLELCWFSVNELPPLLNNMRRTIDAYSAFKISGAFQIL